MDTDDIRNGEVVVGRKFAIRTFPGKEPPEVIQNHLRAAMYRLCVTSKHKDWWMPPETFNRVDLSTETLLVPRISVDLKAVRLPAGVLPVNHNLSVVSKKGGVGLDDLEKIITCQKSQDWFKSHAPKLENGFRSMITTMLRQLPIE